MKALISTLLFYLFPFALSAQISKFIHVDQFGYLPSDNKVAVMSNPQIGYNAGDSYIAPGEVELKNATNNQTMLVISVEEWNNCSTHDMSGDKGWWADFSSFSIAGEYYIFDEVNDEKSATFSIEYNVYDEVLKSAGRMFYYNRCNTTKAAPFAEPNWTDGLSFSHALQDANCRYIYDPDNISLEKDLTGGWFDAGDYNKYVTFAHSVIHDLLWAYTDNPDAFSDNWNIPESGNGIHDIIDEVKWELDWLMKMTNPDGSVHIKMGSESHDQNHSSPPSVNTDPRYYGPTCSSASISIASNFAHAAKVFQSFPSLAVYSSQLQTMAIQAWDYVLPIANSESWEEDCDDGSIVAGDADWTADIQLEAMVTAAVHLFDLTADQGYSQFVIDNFMNTEPISNTFWSVYKSSLTEALLHYTTLPNADISTSATIIASITNDATNNWNGYYGFNDEDLYRAYVPSWTYHWGSNGPIAGYAILNEMLNKYNINPVLQNEYHTKAREQVHYFHGVNPQGMVYLSNMYSLGGDRCANEIYHLWFADGTDWDNAITSPYGPAPGYVTGGVNQSFSIPSISPPSGQPAQKSYLDFNTGWPDNSWEITEPSISYQAKYIRMLAYATEEVVLNSDLSNLDGKSRQDDILLRWYAPENKNAESYIIEKMDKEQNWDKIHKIKPSNKTNYNFIDSNPQNGINTYRINTKLITGQSTYSNVTNVFYNSIDILISPNPASDFISWNSKLNPSSAIFYSTDGQIIMKTNQCSGNKINISGLPVGVFYVRLITKNNLEHSQFFIKSN